MPLEPKNCPAFFTAMIQILRDDWLVLFEETKHTLSTTTSPTTVICSNKIIIKDILL